MKTGLVSTAMAAVTALTVVVGMRLMGTLLISALIVFPAISAMKICRSWRGTVICSVSLAAAGFIAGLISAFAFSLPTGPAVVAALTGNPLPLVSLWVFIAGPIIGATLAAWCYKYLEK